MTLVEELEQAAAAVVESVGPSVVRVGRGPGRGCGVVAGDGLVVTNAHNLRGDEITVKFGDGRQEVATVVAADLDGDLAVLRVDTGESPAVRWAAEGSKPGQVVFAVTRAAIGGERVSFGLVSGTARSFRGPRGRRITGSVEHTAPLLRGSSGSPIVAADGSVLGLNTNRLGDGFYLALPADDDLRARIDSLSKGQTRSRRRLGVGLQPAHVARALRRSVGLPERDGLLVRGVEDGSPADAAGINSGDLLVAADGTPLTTIDDLFDALERAGETMSLQVVRGTEELEITVQFGGESEAPGTE